MINDRLVAAEMKCIEKSRRKNWSRGSSVSIVSGYGLDDRAIGVQSPAGAIGVQSPAGAKDFCSNLCVQTGSEAHPASCTMGTGGPFPGAKRGRGVTLTTHTHLVPKSRMSRSYTSSPPKAPSWHVEGLLCFFRRKNHDRIRNEEIQENLRMNSFGSKLTNI
jgi:hypothetical protein